MAISKRLIAFDSECPMCSRFIQLVDMTVSKSANIYATSSIKVANTKLSLGYNYQEARELEKELKETIIFWDDHELLVRSRAISRICQLSNSRTIRVVGATITLCPQGFCDFIYRAIAANRILISKFFGVKRACTVCKNVTIV